MSELLLPLGGKVRGEDSGFVLLFLNQGSDCFLVCDSGE